MSEIEVNDLGGGVGLKGARFGSLKCVGSLVLDRRARFHMTYRELRSYATVTRVEN